RRSSVREGDSRSGRKRLATVASARRRLDHKKLDSGSSRGLPCKTAMHNGELGAMEIQITYQTWESDEPVRMRLAPEDYFDPVEPGETYEENGIAKYNETWEYLSVPRASLKWSSERRSGTWFDTTFATQYMNGGRSWLTHRADPDGY